MYIQLFTGVNKGAPIWISALQMAEEWGKANNVDIKCTLYPWSEYQDKLYGSCDLGFGSISLRGLLSWEIRNARFGGANANVLMQF